jgi:hypothetical protein
MAICGLFFGSIITRLMMSGMGGADVATSGLGNAFWSFFVILSALILFFPAYYLFNFSSKVRRAIQNDDQAILTESFKNLKSFFKFYGILIIICLSFYALLLIFAVVGLVVGHRA